MIDVICRYNRSEDCVSNQDVGDALGDFFPEIYEEVRENGFKRYKPLKVTGSIEGLCEYFDEEALGIIDVYLTDLAKEAEDFDFDRDFDTWRSRLEEVLHQFFKEMVVEYFMANLIEANISTRMCFDKTYDEFGPYEEEEDDEDDV